MTKRLAHALYVFTVAVFLQTLVGNAQQNAILNGSVADESNSVLPGVTITATELDSGRQTVSISDGNGEYRLLNIPPGRYSLKAELTGFATLVNASMELLVGQNVTFNFIMKVAAVAETVTVAGQAPLVNTRSSEVAGNVDRRQMENLPLQGRNWME